MTVSVPEPNFAQKSGFGYQLQKPLQEPLLAAKDPPKEPPPEFEFVADPPSISAADLWVYVTLCLFINLIYFNLHLFISVYVCLFSGMLLFYFNVYFNLDVIKICYCLFKFTLVYFNLVFVYIAVSLFHSIFVYLNLNLCISLLHFLTWGTYKSHSWVVLKATFHSFRIFP